MTIENFAENIEQLKIYKAALEHESANYSIGDVPAINIKLLPLYAKAWVFDKGRRSIRQYLHNQDVVCQFRYTYTFAPNSNVVTGYSIIIEWMDLSGNVGVRKTITKELSKKYLTTFNREVRINQIDYLVGAGKGFRDIANNYQEPTRSELIAFADIVDSLWVRYETSIDEYINTGTGDLYDLVANESTEPYNTALNYTDPTTTITMRQTILNEIS